MSNTIREHIFNSLDTSGLVDTAFGRVFLQHCHATGYGTTREEYLLQRLDTAFDHHHQHGTPLQSQGRTHHASSSVGESGRRWACGARGSRTRELDSQGAEACCARRDGSTGTLNVAAQRASLHQRQRCCCGPQQIFRRLQGRRPSNDSRRVASRCHTDLWTCTKGTNSEFTGLPFTRRQRGRWNDVARPRSRDQTARAPSSAQAGAISAGADPDGGKNAKTATESA